MTLLRQHFLSDTNERAPVARAALAVVATLLFGISGFTLPETANFPVFIASAHANGYDNNDAAEQMREQAREAAKLAARQAKEQQREAERQARQQQREAERQARQQQREAEKQARYQQHEAEKLAIRQQHEADRQAREAQKEADRQARDNRPAQVDRTPETKSDEPSATPVTRNTQDTPETPTDSRPQPASESPRDTARDVDRHVTRNSEPAEHKPAQDDNDTRDKSADADKTQDDDQQDDDPASGDSGYTHPPATVIEWLKRLGNSNPSKPVVEPLRRAPVAANPVVVTAPVVKPGAVKPVTGKPIKPKPIVKPVIAKVQPPKPLPPKPQPGGRPEPIVIPDFPNPEFLAVNISSAAINQAKAIGFKLKDKTTLSSMDVTVARLVPPAGMSVSDAQSLLQIKMPDANFAINKKYRIYKTATGTTPSALNPASSAQPVGSSGCSGDHCFGSDAIGWTSSMRSCAAGLNIGVMDTGLDTTHPAFRSKSIEVAHFGRGGAGPPWHGTGVTALLAGDPAGGTPGLIPNAKFYVADVFHADDDGQPASDTLSMLRGFDWLERRGVKIINMSLSGPADDLIRDAVVKLSAKNVMFVAAAGNDGIGAAPSFPAAYNEVIAVTAISKDLKNYRYANRGDYIDMAAPGVAIWTALPGALEGYHSGTSFAAPYVTAALAAIYKDLPDKKKSTAMAQLSFRDLGEPGRDQIYGQGLIVAPQSCSGSGKIADKRAPAAAPSWSPSVQSEKSTEQLPWLGLGLSDNP